MNMEEDNDDDIQVLCVKTPTKQPGPSTSSIPQGSVIPPRGGHVTVASTASSSVLPDHRTLFTEFTQWLESNPQALQRIQSVLPKGETAVINQSDRRGDLIESSTNLLPSAASTSSVEAQVTVSTPIGSATINPALSTVIPVDEQLTSLMETLNEDQKGRFKEWYRSSQKSDQTIPTAEASTSKDQEEQAIIRVGDDKEAADRGEASGAAPVTISPVSQHHAKSMREEEEGAVVGGSGETPCLTKEIAHNTRTPTKRKWQANVPPTPQTPRKSIDDNDIGFWSGQNKDLHRCPRCALSIPFGTSNKLRTLRAKHYYQFHYDISTSKSRCEIERWVEVKLGSGDHLWKDERVCLHCPADGRMHAGREELLRHIQKKHPSAFDKMKKEYVEIATNGKTAEYAVHKIFLPSFSLTPVKSEPGTSY